MSIHHAVQSNISISPFLPKEEHLIKMPVCNVIQAADDKICLLPHAPFQYINKNSLSFS